MTVAKEPNVRCNLGALNISLERRADFDMGHGSWETPDVLRRKVVPVVWGTWGNLCCNPFISNPHYVMSSRRGRVEMIITNNHCDSLEIKSA